MFLFTRLCLNNDLYWIVWHVVSVLLLDSISTTQGGRPLQSVDLIRHPSKRVVHITVLLLHSICDGDADGFRISEKAAKKIGILSAGVWKKKMQSGKFLQLWWIWWGSVGAFGAVYINQNAKYRALWHVDKYNSINYIIMVIYW